MFQSVSLEEAAARHWDVVVAGTSFASMFFVRALPRDLSAEAFAADFAAAETAGGGRKARIYRAYFRLKPTRLPALVGAEERVEERLVRAFLHSTNIAQVHPDTSEFRYGGLFDPYETSCGNHLSAHFLA